MRKAQAQKRRIWTCAAAVPLAAGLLLGVEDSHAGPLDPFAFSTIGTLNVNSGSITINTDTLAITGAATFTGVTFNQISGPQMAVFNFGSFNIGAGVTINVTGSRPLALLSRDSMTIASGITLSGGNATVPDAGAAGPAGGFAGGAGGINGTGPGAGGNLGFNGHGGGGGYGGAGNAGEGSAGPSYGNLLDTIQGGSGGAGGLWSGPGGGGGGGAGAIELGAIGTLTLASILANGGSGGDTFGGAGGGGAGGGILLHADAYALTTVQAAGGNSPQLAGAGGGGRIALAGGTLTASQINAMLTSVNGGNNGFGATGTAGVLTFRPITAIVQAAQTLNVGITPAQTGRTDPRIETLPGSLIVQGAATANLISSIDWNAGSVLSLTGGTLNIANSTTFTSNSTLNWSAGTMIVGSGQALTIRGGLATVAGNAGLSNGATLRISNAGQFNAAGYFDIGSTNRGGGGAAGTLIVDGLGSQIVAGGAFSEWGGKPGEAATVSFSNEAVGTYSAGLRVAAAGTARVDLSSNAQLNVASISAGGAGSSATFNISGGTLNALGNVTFSTGAVLNWTSGGLLIQSGNTLAFDGGVGSFDAGAGFSDGATLRIVGGGAVVTANYLDIGNANTGGATGTMFISGPGSRFETATTYTDWGRNAGDAASITIQNSGAATYAAGLQIGADGGNASVNLLSSGKLYTTNLVLGGGVPVGPAPKVNINGGELLVDGDANISTRGGVDFLSGTFSVAGALFMSDNGTLMLSAGGNKTLRAAALSISGTSKINLADNDLIIDYAEDSPIDAIKAYIVLGRNGGNWLGNGITSTSSDAFVHGLGYGENGLLGFSTFGGQPVDSDTLLVKYTWYGDGNLDGKVDIADLYLLASNYNGAGKLWTSGDFNYDGVTNAVDLGLLARNWQAGSGAPLSMSLDSVLSIVGLSRVSVPEPSAGLVMLAGCSVFRRRRR